MSDIIHLIKRFELAPNDMKAIEDLKSYFKRVGFVLDTEDNLNDKYALDLGKELLFNKVNNSLCNLMLHSPELCTIINQSDDAELRKRLTVYIKNYDTYFDTSTTHLDILSYTMGIINWADWIDYLRIKANQECIYPRHPAYVVPGFHVNWTPIETFEEYSDKDLEEPPLYNSDHIESTYTQDAQEVWEDEYGRFDLMEEKKEEDMDLLVDYVESKYRR